uniref:mechanosensitive ion channel protein 10-like n=1 Tax=Erigeron canadensis TaxID=72917 RepID=UPI001CB892A5|nr:mechanosensitive ion channel protein 10-like [Erigeron canadensis]
MKMDSGEVRVEIPAGADCKNSISGNHPNNIEDVVHLHDHDPPDSGLRSRKKVPALTAIAEMPKTNLITTTSQSQLQAEEDAGQLKPKSRFNEPAIPSEENIVKENVTASAFEMLETPKAAASPVTPRTPIMASPSKANDDNDENGHYPTRKRPKKIKVLFIIEFSLFVCITLVLILSTTMNMLEDKEIWSLELWKWCGFGLAIFSGRLFSMWLMNIVVFFIETNSLLRKNVWYFVYTAHKSFWVFIWLGLILLTWVLLIVQGVTRSSDTTKVLNYITRGIASTLVVAGAWILRTIVVKFLYASFYEKRFFERIQENIFHQYILQTLSVPPLMELSEMINGSRLVSCRGSNVIDVKFKEKTVIDVQKLQNMKRGSVSAWTMSRLIKIASQSGFYTVPDTLDESEDLINPDEQNNRTITNEWEAKVAGHLIFRNVAKPGYKYIEEEDLLRFMIKEEADVVFTSIGRAEESGRINKKSVMNWVVSMYMKSKFLEHSLNDINGAIKELNKFVTGLLIIVLIILWVILMGIVATEVLLFISSQFLLAVFTFGSSAKSTFEAMIFVFVKHPFDVGDRCVIDGVQVVVEEVSILTSVFLRYDNEKIYYPNSILATKSISNFNRSPEMRDIVEFDLDASTSVEKISQR